MVSAVVVLSISNAESKRADPCNVSDRGERFFTLPTAHHKSKMWSCTFFDEAGRPSFNALQNFGSALAPVVYYVFDVMMLRGVDLRREPLTKRLALLESKVLPKLKEPIRYAGVLDAALPVLIKSVKQQGPEGLVAKRLASVKERCDG